jgi:hypothetical protein
MSDYTNAVTGVLTSIVRTAVPYLVGLIVTLAAKAQLELDEGTIESIGALLTVVVGTVYYAIVRELETRFSPSWGWLLGLAKRPAYEG